MQVYRQYFKIKDKIVFKIILQTKTRYLWDNFPRYFSIYLQCSFTRLCRRKSGWRIRYVIIVIFSSSTNQVHSDWKGMKPNILFDPNGSEEIQTRVSIESTQSDLILQHVIIHLVTVLLKKYLPIRTVRCMLGSTNDGTDLLLRWFQLNHCIFKRRRRDSI